MELLKQILLFVLLEEHALLQILVNVTLDIRDQFVNRIFALIKPPTMYLFVQVMDLVILQINAHAKKNTLAHNVREVHALE
jgi:hypothetical protein